MTVLLRPVCFSLLVAALAVLLPFGAQAQEGDSLTLQVRPEALQLDVGESGRLDVKVLDAEGQEVTGGRLSLYARERRALEVKSPEEIVAHQPGEHTLVVVRPLDGGGRLVREVPVSVAFPPIAEVAFAEAPEQAYAGTHVPIRAEAVDATGAVRSGVEITYASQNPEAATVDRFGRLAAKAPGRTTITAEAEGVEAATTVEILENPTARLELAGGADEVRTGDVVDFDATALTEDGRPIVDVPITYAVRARPADERAPTAAGQIDAEGRFVAEGPGLYTVVATSGGHVAEATVRVVPRSVEGEIEVVGRGRVGDVHTSDLWVWEGADGRDYVITGTWGANGEAYFWDVSDPSTPAIIDTVTVDARTVNDVKVSEDGQVCVISREGASNRKNGIVILDCSNPSDVQILAEYTDGLTGGVHNLFIYQGHVYAVNNGRRYDVINIEDPAAPERVGRFELDTPGRAIHDVWIQDGIAYSSNWDDGVVIADVGGGDAGGSPENPVLMGQYTYPSGWNHAAFPFTSNATGTFYVIAGDEAFPYGLYTEDRPTRADGWLHFIDFSDMDNPKEVARYQVPEAGSHNYWVDDDEDLLYVAYYNGGLRVVDISGDLMGNLYEQGREVARFFPDDPEGKIANAPMVWGPQPHKGHLFFSDWNSGLWVVKLKRGEGDEQPVSAR